MTTSRLFADDRALIDETVTQLQQLTDSVESVAREVGLVLNADKTKCMTIGKADDTIQIKVVRWTITHSNSWKSFATWAVS